MGTVSQLKIPPHDLRLEYEILGAMMSEPSAAADALKQGLSPEHFYGAANGLIASAAIECWNATGACGVFAVFSRLQDAGHLDAVGGIDRLREFADHATPSCASSVASRIMEFARRRGCFRVGADLLNEVSAGTDSSVAAGEAIRRIAEIEAGRADGGEIMELAQKRIDWIAAVRGGSAEDRSVFFDYLDLDNIIHGARRGSFIALGGFTSVGKTAIALNIARRICRQELNVDYFTLELTKEELTERQIALESGVDYDHIIHPTNMSDEEWMQMADCMKRMGELEGRFRIVHEVSMSTASMRTKLVAARHTGRPVDFVVLDYLQIAEPADPNKRRHSRENVVSDIAKEIRQIAKDLDCVFFALCQVNDAVAARKTPEITISDMRESKSIGKHSDITMLMHYNSWEDAHRTNAVMTINVAKHNSGKTGKCELMFDKAHQTFANYTKEDLPSWVTGDT